jgi:hypothetical protein
MYLGPKRRILRARAFSSLPPTQSHLMLSEDKQSLKINN